MAKIEVQDVRLIMWDLGGEPSLHGIWEQYYKEAHGIIFVVDGSDPSALDKSRHAYSMCSTIHNSSSCTLFPSSLSALFGLSVYYVDGFTFPDS